MEADAQEMFADDIEPGFGQQMVDVADAAGQRILDREQRISGATLGDGRDRVLESGAGQCRHVRKGLTAGDMRIGAGLALEGDGVFR